MKAKSILFVPATRPDRFEKAIDSGADIVLLDLEDAVGAEDKEIARKHLVTYFASAPAPMIAIRINSPFSFTGMQDIVALKNAHVQPNLWVLPKVESPEMVNVLGEIMQTPTYKPAILAMIETPKGLHAMRNIAIFSPYLVGFALGAADFSNELNVQPTWDVLHPYRAQMLATAKEFGLQMIDSPYFEIKNPDGLTAECQKLRSIGFDGKFAIHPTQVNIINTVFYPTEKELAYANILVQAFEASHQGAIQIEGQMIDKPIYEKYKRWLEKYKV